MTGGSGFIGGRLIERLVADGVEVRALSRSQGSAEAVSALGAEPVRGELGDESSIAAGAQGCSVAYHLAALASEWGPRAEFVEANVIGTRNVLAGAREGGVRRFVHAGTEAALMAGEPLVDVDESAPLRPDSKAHYPATKAESEQTVRAASEGGFETVVVRPRLVWGRGDTTLLPEIVAAVESGRFAWISGGEHLTSTTHVENVVHGMRLAAERGGAGEAYFVTDGEPVRFREFVTALLEASGVEPPTRSLPSPVAGAVAAAGETAWRLLPLPGAPPLTRLAYWLSAQQCTLDISKARAELGYEPVVTREAGLAELADAGDRPRP